MQGRVGEAGGDGGAEGLGGVLDDGHAAGASSGKVL
jgi:hypothetical protein